MHGSNGTRRTVNLRLYSSLTRVYLASRTGNCSSCPRRSDLHSQQLCGRLCCCLLTRESTLGENRQFEAATHAKLVKNVGQMALHRVLAESEPLGDRLVRLAFDDRRNDLKLA